MSNSVAPPKMQMDASGRQQEQFRLKKRSLGSEAEQPGESSFAVDLILCPDFEQTYHMWNYQ